MKKSNILGLGLAGLIASVAEAQPAPWSFEAIRFREQNSLRNQVEGFMEAKVIGDKRIHKLVGHKKYEVGECILNPEGEMYKQSYGEEGFYKYMQRVVDELNQKEKINSIEDSYTLALDLGNKNCLSLPIGKKIDSGFEFDNSEREIESGPAVIRYKPRKLSGSEVSLIEMRDSIDKSLDLGDTMFLEPANYETEENTVTLTYKVSPIIYDVSRGEFRRVEELEKFFQGDMMKQQRKE